MCAESCPKKLSGHLSVLLTKFTGDKLSDNAGKDDTASHWDLKEDFKEDLKDLNDLRVSCWRLCNANDIS